MIRFHCKKCGQLIAVARIYAGKKGKCPNCKNIVVVPQNQTPVPKTTQHPPEQQKAAPKDSAYNLMLLDVPDKHKAKEQQKGRQISDAVAQDTTQFGEIARAAEPEPVARRELPWIIDIFLYPASKAWLTTVGVIIGTQLLLIIVAKLLGILTMAFPPFLVFLAFFSFLGIFIRIVLYLYFFWYFCQCVRDSALGGIRAPETIGTTPGIGEMLWQLFRVVVCLAFFLAPALIYFQHTRNIDLIFWSLLGYAALFFPMGLLAVIMFDSFSALNPIFLVGSIFSTFLPYLGLVLFYYVLCNMPILIIALLRRAILPQSLILSFLLQLVSMYITIIGGHLLGRFYFRYQEKLNWDV